MLLCPLDGEFLAFVEPEEHLLRAHPGLTPAEHEGLLLYLEGDDLENKTGRELAHAAYDIGAAYLEDSVATITLLRALALLSDKAKAELAALEQRKG